MKKILKLIKLDAYRYTGKNDVVSLYCRNICFRYTFWMRISAGLGRGLVTFPIRVFAKMKLRALSYKAGIQISPGTKIDESLYIGHIHAKVGCI